MAPSVSTLQRYSVSVRPCLNQPLVNNIYYVYISLPLVHQHLILTRALVTASTTHVHSTRSVHLVSTPLTVFNPGPAPSMWIRKFRTELVGRQRDLDSGSVSQASVSQAVPAELRANLATAMAAALAALDEIERLG